MGRLFELNGERYEVFSDGSQGVRYVNLTTQQSARIQSPQDVPDHWPEDVKASLQGANFVHFDHCPICRMPEAPLCGCLHGLGDDADWRVPRVLTRIDPPPRIDPLHQHLERATMGLRLLCLLTDRDARSRLAAEIDALFAEHTRRQVLIADRARQHYEDAANVLRNYARECHDTIAALWRERAVQYRQSRQDLLEAALGERECVSCHERAPLRVAVPCLHASMCGTCWEGWEGAKGGRTCPECRAPVEGLHGLCRFNQE